MSGLLIGLGVGPELVAESELAIGSGLVVGSGLVSELDGPSLILMMSGLVAISELSRYLGISPPVAFPSFFAFRFIVLPPLATAGA